jgi:hypothetical protein
VLTSAAIQAILGPPGMLLAFLFIVPFNGGGAGGLGVYLLPVYWRNIGVTLPSQNAGTLISNVLYFGGNGISTALVVLFAWALVAGVVVWYSGRTRAARAPAAYQVSEGISTGGARSAQRCGKGRPSVCGRRRRT